MDPSVYNFDPTNADLNMTNTPDMGDILNTGAYSGYDPLDYSYWNYIPLKSANLAFAILFGISALTFVVQGIFSKKKWLGFTIAMVSGCVLEVIGYVGRVMANDDVFSETPFLIQIICLTIAPAFLAAGIYLCLARITRIFGIANSRIKPRIYPVVFITCDVNSLALQATGGGIASVRVHQGEDTKTGDNIMIAGLGFQVFTMFAFILLALDFAVRTIRSSRQASALATIESENAKLRKTWIFKGFLAALSLSTLCIFSRCVFRVAELSKGWEGELMQKQHYFIGLEGAVIVAAAFFLNMFHPGLCLREKKERTGETGARLWFGLQKTTSRESILEGQHVAEQDRSSRDSS